MADRISTAARSRNMKAVRSKGTVPELYVRRALSKQGFRFRLNQKDLPGSPDIVLRRHRLSVFVHGCFWHGHCCLAGRRPTSNENFWNCKLDENLKRDRRNQTALSQAGWMKLGAQVSTVVTAVTK